MQQDKLSKWSVLFDYFWTSVLELKKQKKQVIFYLLLHFERFFDKSSDWFLKDHLEQRFAPEFNFKSNWLLQIGDTQILQCWIFTNFIEF